MFGNSMVQAMFWEFPTKVISIFLLFTFQFGSRIVSFKYMHDISNINTMALYSGSSMKDVRTNLGLFGTLLPLSRPVHIWLTTGIT